MNFYKERINKLKYSAIYRGCKESEVILRRFIEFNLENMNEESLNLFEEVLKLEDGPFLDYIYKRIDLEKDEFYKRNRIMREMIEWVYCV